MIAQDTEEAAYMLRKLVETYMKWGLPINFGKKLIFNIGLGGGGGTENNWNWKNEDG
jgi:hypothetical protein